MSIREGGTQGQPGHWVSEQPDVIEERPPDPRDERIVALEAEVKGMRDRVAAVEVANADVQALRDAVRGPDSR